MLRALALPGAGKVYRTLLLTQARVRDSKSSKGILIALLLLTFLIPAAYAAITYRVSVISTGTIINNGILAFTDEDLTTRITRVHWRDMTPGERDTKTIYIKNTSNAPVTVRMTVTDWNPTSAEGSINIQWDSEDAVIQPGEAIQVVITCTISPMTTNLTYYRCNINIIATE